MVLHPDEPHNGRSGLATGFGYRMLYIEPSRIRDALDIRSLPFVSQIVFNDAALARTIFGCIRSLPAAPS